jgi:hypothetical protein
MTPRTRNTENQMIVFINPRIKKRTSNIPKRRNILAILNQDG